MSEILPENYPNGLNDDELIKKIQEYQLLVNKTSKSAKIIGASQWKNIAELGQNELLRRSLEKQIKENKTAKRINYWLNGITITLAIITSVVGYNTLQFAHSDQITDKIWMQNQIDRLESNQGELIKINETLNRMIALQESDSTAN